MRLLHSWVPSLWLLLGAPSCSMLTILLLLLRHLACAAAFHAIPGSCSIVFILICIAQALVQ